MLVSFLSMGWRVGIVVAAAVPLTLAAVFVVMAATGKDFDRVAPGSLILALGLLVDGVIPTLLLFRQPFGINALVGLIALSGILMRNTLILIGRIRQNEKDGFGEQLARRYAGTGHSLVLVDHRHREPTVVALSVA